MISLNESIEKTTMPTKTFLLRYLLTVCSFACAYFGLYVVQMNVMAEFEFLPMASILFLPAGVKFLAMLVGRTAGVGGVVVGIALVNHVTAEAENYIHINMFAMVLWLLLPYVLLRVYLNARGHGKHLRTLTAFDVAVLTIMVSFVGSLGAQLYWYEWNTPVAPLLRVIWVMFIGETSGIFLMLGIVIVIRRLFFHDTRNHKP
tara:strand:+ start:1215 stop:1823 length:609 start_codon:yes stop_codon:yes gene_type:complete